MFTEIQTNESELSLKEQFLKQLEKNIQLEYFRQSEAKLRSKLKKDIDKGVLF